MKFKKTKIGLVPKDWEVKKLGEIGKLVGGGTPSTKNAEYWRGDIPWISSSDLIENSITYINIHKFINEEAIKQSATKLIPKNSLLIVSRVGVGKIAINKTKLCTSQDFQSFIPQIYINITYLAYYLHKNIKQLMRLNQGTSIKGITKKDIENFLIPIPLLKEQQKIAKILLTCDEMIEKQEKLIKEKEKLKKGLMQKLLNVELRVERGELKKLPKVRFKEFSGEWVEKKLGELVEEYTKKNDEEYQPVAIGIYGIRKRVDIFSKSLTNNIRVNKVIFKNTLTFGLGTKQIVFGILLDNQYYSVSPAYKTFKIFSKQIVPSFLNYLLILENKKLSSKYMIISSRQGKSVNIKELLQHKFIIPPTLKEQEKIADVLSTLDKEIDLLKLELEEYKKLKKSLMQKLLTGKVRVRI